MLKKLTMNPIKGNTRPLKPKYLLLRLCYDWGFCNSNWGIGLCLINYLSMNYIISIFVIKSYLKCEKRRQMNVCESCLILMLVEDKIILGNKVKLSNFTMFLISKRDRELAISTKVHFSHFQVHL